MLRTGILGGTFDPPHSAHLAMARTAIEQIPLDRVLLVPAPRPPHKSDSAMTPYETRVRMVSLLVANEPGCEVSRLEEFRQGPSYTVELLEQCRKSWDDELYLLIGADSAADLVSWKHPQRILELVTLVIFPRTGFDSVVPVEGPASVVVFEEPVIEISSSAIRERAAKGESLDDCTPKAVREFILDNSLYS